MDDLIRKATDTVLYSLTRKGPPRTSGEMCDAAIREYIRLAEQVQHVAGGDCAECGPLRAEVERLRGEERIAEVARALIDSTAIVHDDERLGYIDVQVDREDWREFKLWFQERDCEEE